MHIGFEIESAGFSVAGITRGYLAKNLPYPALYSFISLGDSSSFMYGFVETDKRRIEIPYKGTDGRAWPTGLSGTILQLSIKGGWGFEVPAVMDLEIANFRSGTEYTLTNKKISVNKLSGTIEDLIVKLELVKSWNEILPTVGPDLNAFRSAKEIYENIMKG